MKLLLMTPLVKQDVRYPISGLAYLAAHVRDLCDDVAVFIPKAQETTAETFRKKLETFEPDVVGLNLFSLTYSRARETLQIVKQHNPEIVTVLGGPHPSGDPEGTLNDLEEADFSFSGEAEIGFRMFMEKYKADPENLSRPEVLETIPGLCYRTGGGVKVNAQAFVQNLNALPLPAYDLMPPDDFLSASGSGYQKSEHIGYITASRGCAGRCAFCSGHTVSGRKVRLRDPQAVVEELAILADQFGIEEIQFTDSDIAWDKEHLRRLCQGMVDRGLRLQWSCAACSDSLDADLVRLMKESGCYMVRIGIETASKRLLKILHKPVNLRKVKDNIRMIRKAGIRAHGFFMFGFPTETMEDIQETLKFSFHSGLDSASFSIFQPLPGCELYEKYVTDEVKGKLNWDNFDFFKDSQFEYNVPFPKLKDIQRRAYIFFYLHPRRLFSLLALLTRPSSLRTFLLMARRNLSGG